MLFRPKRKMPWLLCYPCSKKTRHRVKAAYERREENAYNLFSSTHHDYYIVACSACATTTFLHEYIIDYEHTHTLQYPNPARWANTALFLSPAQLFKLPPIIRELYTEIRAAFCEELNVLCSIGLRTLVEAFCTEQHIPGVNLKEKIKNLPAKGWITAAQLPVLNKLRMSGNVSRNKIKVIPTAMLEHTIQLANHMLKTVYILPAPEEKNEL